jgi:hypothetical protein
MASGTLINIGDSEGVFRPRGWEAQIPIPVILSVRDSRKTGDSRKCTAYRMRGETMKAGTGNESFNRSVRGRTEKFAFDHPPKSKAALHVEQLIADEKREKERERQRDAQEQARREQLRREAEERNRTFQNAVNALSQMYGGQEVKGALQQLVTERGEMPTPLRLKQEVERRVGN